MKEVSLKIYPCFLPMLWSSNLLIQLFRFLSSTWPEIVFLVLLHIWDTTVGDRYSIYCLDSHWARFIPFCLVPSTVVKHCCYLLFLFFFCLFWLYLAYIFFILWAFETMGYASRVLQKLYGTSCANCKEFVTLAFDLDLDNLPFLLRLLQMSMGDKWSFSCTFTRCFTPLHLVSEFYSPQDSVLCSPHISITVPKCSYFASGW